MATPTVPKTQRRVVLANRPTGEPSGQDFRVEERPVPEPGPGQILVRGIYLSLDPYMRGRMGRGTILRPARRVGEVMGGGIVGEVVESNSQNYRGGRHRRGRVGWQEYAVAAAPAAQDRPRWRPSRPRIGILGMPGLRPTSACSTSANPSPARRSSSRRRRAPSARWSARSPSWRVVASSASPAAPRSAPASRTSSGSTLAWTTRPEATSRPPSRPPAPTASMSISTTSAGRSPTQYSPTSTSGPASQPAARSRSTMHRRPSSGRARRGSSSGAA